MEDLRGHVISFIVYYFPFYVFQLITAYLYVGITYLKQREVMNEGREYSVKLWFISHPKRQSYVNIIWDLSLIPELG